MHSWSKMMRRALFGTALLAGAAASAQPVMSMGAPIPKEWFVLLEDNVDPHAKAAELSQTYGVKILHVYDQAMKGFAFQDQAVSSQAVGVLSSDFQVSYVLQNRVVVGMTQTRGTGIERIQAHLNPLADIDGVDERIDLNVAVVDTGIDTAHDDLNVTGGVDCTQPGVTGGSYADENGHGTHVAGIIGALDNDRGTVGVAPGVRLWSVKVLDKNGIGSIASVACGVDWITRTRRDSDPNNDIAVANLSLGTYGSDDNGCGTLNEDILHRAICSATSRGVTFVVAAGNSNADSAAFVPAAYDEVITVSAIADSDGKPGGLGPVTAHGNDDRLAAFSNWGVDVDVAAPGVRLQSSALGGGTTELSGTSQSTAFVTGVLALHLSQQGVPSNREGVARAKAALLNPAEGYTVAQGGNEGFSGDRDSSAEPLLLLRAPPAVIHDLAVTDIQVPGPVTLGAAVQVSVTVRNEGTATETFRVTLVDVDPNLQIGRREVTLAAGAQQQLSFTFQTNDTTTVGTHTLRATAAALEGESDLADNQRQATLEVRAETRRDVAVRQLSGPSSVLLNSQSDWDITVANEGDVDETFDVELKDKTDNVSIGKKRVTVAKGQTQVVRFTWSVGTATSQREHLLEATAYAVPGETEMHDNTQTATVKVEARPIGLTSHVADLDGFARQHNKNQWRPRVTVVIHDGTNQPLPNATVSGTFSFGGKRRGVSCVTDGAGFCEVNGGNFKNGESPVVFTVDAVSHSVNIYQASSNTDPDGDSTSGTKIVISR